jgi:UDP-N-acetylmuramyl pentapeptide phosphotransferase/UDP-N-acetylglucosamine-1-phosphate transferase
VLATVVLAFAAAAILTPLIARLMRRANVMDVPNHRSSHRDPTPRGGGVAVAVVVTVGLLASRSGGTTRAGVVVAGAAFALVGLLEDLVGVPALRRLPLQFLAAGLALPWLLQPFHGPTAWRVLVAAGVVFWLVSYVNACNFMDGINGLAAGQSIVVGVTWYVVGRAEGALWLATLGAILAAGALGFAPHNFPRARVFLGDVGSYFVGGFVAAAAVFALAARVPPEAVLAPLALYVTDTGVTLARRVLRGERWYESHRQHTYQRLTTTLGDSHLSGTIIVVVLTALCSALGCLSLVGSPTARIVGDLGVVSVLLAYLGSPALAARSRRRQPALA